MNDDVMIAVDTHKAIETARFANSDEGYARLSGFARRSEHRR